MVSLGYTCSGKNYIFSEGVKVNSITSVSIVLGASLPFSALM